MAVSWTAHRFSGGNLALDTTNTVVLRGEPARSFDRFDDVGEIARFAAVASGFRALELGGRVLSAPEPRMIAGTVLEIREATDRLFRRGVEDGALETSELSAFTQACSRGLAGQSTIIGRQDAPFGDACAPIAFETALAVSALSLLSAGALRRIRICSNCGWLFLDASRNASRIWCDMAVCGNRQKARRHYRRQISTREEEQGHA